MSPEALRRNFRAVMDSPDQGVPTHMGFDMRVVALMALAKVNPTPENLRAAEEALEDQIATGGELFDFTTTDKPGED